MIEEHEDSIAAHEAEAQDVLCGGREPPAGLFRLAKHPGVQLRRQRFT